MKSSSPTKTNSTLYKTVSYQDAHANKEYRQVVKHMFQEQAARIIQRTWRNHSHKKFTGKYTETLKGPLSLHFLKEPWGLQAAKHAAQIKKGQWLRLDFDDPEFQRNLFKALHQGKITVNEMATALLLYTGSIQFKDTPITQYYFTMGPYS